MAILEIGVSRADVIVGTIGARAGIGCWGSSVVANVGGQLDPPRVNVALQHASIEWHVLSSSLSRVPDSDFGSVLHRETHSLPGFADYVSCDPDGMYAGIRLNIAAGKDPPLPYVAMVAGPAVVKGILRRLERLMCVPEMACRFLLHADFFLPEGKIRAWVDAQARRSRRAGFEEKAVEERGEPVPSTDTTVMDNLRYEQWYMYRDDFSFLCRIESM